MTQDEKKPEEQHIKGVPYLGGGAPVHYGGTPRSRWKVAKAE